MNTCAQTHAPEKVDQAQIARQKDEEDGVVDLNHAGVLLDGFQQATVRSRQVHQSQDAADQTKNAPGTAGGEKAGFRRLIRCRTAADAQQNMHGKHARQTAHA